MRMSDWSSDVCSSDRKQEELAGEVEPAENAGDHGHDHIIGQRCDDLAECAADNDRDRQIQHIAARDERLELAEHFHPRLFDIARNEPFIALECKSFAKQSPIAHATATL